MLVSENALKWAMRLYPPLLFQRIWVIKIEKGFRGVKVKVNKSLFNYNYNGSIFGGTIFSAADPFYPLLFHQLFKHKGYNLRVWLKSADIKYLKPGRTDLFFTISLSETEIAGVEVIMNTAGKFTRYYPIEMRNELGELCVLAVCEVYMRNTDLDDPNYKAVKNNESNNE